MVSLAEFSKNRRTIPVVYFNATIDVTYRPAAYTAEVAAQAIDQPVGEFLELLIDSWDLTDENDTPIETDADSLVKLPLRLLQECAAAIIRDVRLGEAESS